jgi:general secretion pathway protein H
MSATGSAGFTLLETLAAVGVMAVTGAIAFPAVERATAAMQFSQAKASLFADLKVARALALSSGAPVAVTAAADGGGYAWSSGPVRRLPAAVRLTERGELAFYPDGSAREGDLVMADRRRHVRVLISATGTIEVDPAPQGQGGRS